MIRNITRNTILATTTRTAAHFWEKLGGLLLRPKPLEKNEAFIIPSFAPWVHTCFMKQTIDCVFLNRKNRVVGLEQLFPWSLGKMHWRADRVVELSVGAISESQTQLGDQIEISR